MRFSWLGPLMAAALLSALTFLSISLPVLAEGPFSAAIRVNSGIITHYEIAERTKLVEALGGATDPRAEAQKMLINEKLQAQEAQRLDITADPEEVEESLGRFAEQRGLTLEQVYQALDARKINPDDLRHFLSAAILWRNVIQTKFARQARPSEADIDAALNVLSGTKPEQILLAELAMPFAEHGEANAMALANQLVTQVRNGANFSALARRYSRTPSARRGGRLDWMPARNLPPAIAAQILTLRPGDVTEPISLPNGVTILQLVDIREGEQDSEAKIVVGYAQLRLKLTDSSPQSLANARQSAATIAARTDTCRDLAAYAHDHGQQEAVIEAQLLEETPADIALALAQLDPGEISTDISDANSLTMLMLCNRSIETAAAGREELREGIYNQRMQRLGDNFLEELRRNAAIIFEE